VLFDVPMTEVLSLNKALAACNVPYPPTLQGWVLPGLKGCGWLDYLVVFSMIFAPVPLLPEICLGLCLAVLAYIKVAMVLAVVGFPFCFGLIFLIWAHTWCFLWGPLFFCYYIIRGVAYGVPCRMRLVMEGFGLLKQWALSLYPTPARPKPPGSPLRNSSPEMASIQLRNRSPEMASIPAQAAWVAASAASAAGLDAGWRWAGKDIGTSQCRKSPSSSPDVSGGGRRMAGSPRMEECFPPLPRAQIDDDDDHLAPLLESNAGVTLPMGHLQPIANQSQGAAMASAG